MTSCPRCAQLEANLDVYREIHDMVTPEEKRMLWKELKEGKA